jgi:hypothetical protein
MKKKKYLKMSEPEHKRPADQEGVLEQDDMDMEDEKEKIAEAKKKRSGSIRREMKNDDEKLHTEMDDEDLEEEDDEEEKTVSEARKRKVRKEQDEIEMPLTKEGIAAAIEEMDELDEEDMEKVKDMPFAEMKKLYKEMSCGNMKEARKLMDSYRPEDQPDTETMNEPSELMGEETDGVVKPEGGDDHNRPADQEARLEAKKARKRAVKEAFQGIFKGQDLTEEFKGNAFTIFESAVNTCVRENTKVIEKEALSEMKRRVSRVESDLVEQIDGYLELVVEEWLDQNRLAVERGIKVEIAESLLAGLKGVLLEHNIDVPADKEDLLEQVSSEKESLEEEVESMARTMVSLKEEIAALHRDKVLAEASKNLTETQAVKLKSLVEDVEFVDAASYAKKVKTIKEHHFDGGSSSKGEDVRVLSEETDNSTVKKYVDFVGQQARKERV